jgi:hypothetical protein
MMMNAACKLGLRPECPLCLENRMIPGELELQP